MAVNEWDAFPVVQEPTVASTSSEWDAFPVVDEQPPQNEWDAFPSVDEPDEPYRGGYKDPNALEMGVVGAAEGTLGVGQAAGAGTTMIGDYFDQLRSNIMGATSGLINKINPEYIEKKRLQAPSELKERRKNLLQSVGETAYDTYKGQLEDIQQTYPSGDITRNPKLLLDPGWWTRGIAQAGTSMSTGMLAGGGTGIGAAVAGAGIEALPNYVELIDEGMSGKEAVARTLAFATFVAASEKLSLDKMFRGKSKSKIRKALIAMLSEGLQEASEEPADAIITNLARDGITPTEYGKKILESFRSGANVFLTAAVTGGGASIAGMGAEGQQQPAQPSTLPDSVQADIAPVQTPDATQELTQDVIPEDTSQELSPAMQEELTAIDALQSEITALPLTDDQKIDMWENVQSAETLEEAQAIVEQAKQSIATPEAEREAEKSSRPVVPDAGAEAISSTETPAPEAKTTANVEAERGVQASAEAETTRPIEQQQAAGVKVDEGIVTADEKPIADIRSEMQENELEGEMQKFTQDLRDAEHKASVGGQHGKQPIMDDEGNRIGWHNVGRVYPEGFRKGDAAAIEKFLKGKKKLTPRQADVVGRAFDKISDELEALKASQPDMVTAEQLPMGSKVQIQGKEYTVTGETDTAVELQNDEGKSVFVPFEDAVGTAIDAGSLQQAPTEAVAEDYRVPEETRVEMPDKEAPAAKVDDHRMSHRAPTGEFGEGSLDAMDRTYPADVYASDAGRIYGDSNDRLNTKAARIIHSLRGKPDKLVTIYRAVPKGRQSDISQGDWVTPVREYAKEHGMRFEGGYDIIEKTVPAREVFTEGNSLFEYGWKPQAKPEAPAAKPKTVEKLFGVDNLKLSEEITDNDNVRYQLYESGEKSVLRAIDVDSGEVIRLTKGTTAQMKAQYDEATKLARKEAAKPKTAETPSGQKLLIDEGEGGLKLTGEKATDTFRIAEEKEKAELAKAESEKQQGDLFGESKKPTKGVGAAAAGSQGEFGPETSGTQVTGIRKAINEIERKSLGKESEITPATRSWKEVSREVEQDLTHNSMHGTELVDSLAKRPRVLTDTDVIHLTVEKQRRMQAYNEAASESVAAKESGNLDRIETAKQNLTQTSERLDKIFDVIASGGSKTMTARALAAMRAMMDDQFNLQTMKQKIREKQNGKALSKEQVEQAEAIERQYKKRVEYLEEQRKIAVEEKQAVQQELDRARDRVMIDNIITEVMKTPKKKQQLRANALSRAEKLKARGRERIAKMGGQMASGVNPERVLALAEIGAGYVIEGAVAFSDFVAKMRVEVANMKISDDEYRKIHEQARKIANDELGEAAQEVAKTETTKGKKADADVSPESMTVKQIFKMVVEMGERGYDNIVDKAFEIVQTVKPEMTRTEMLVAASDWGKRKERNETALEAEHRKVLSQVRTETQKALSLKHIKETQTAPPKTGEARPKLTLGARAKQREAKRLMKELGIETVDKETQQASALSAIQSRLQNEIDDINHALEKNERMVEDGRMTKVQYDEATKNLKARRDERKKVYDEVFPPKPPSREQQLRSLIVQGGRTLQNLNKKAERVRNGETPDINGASMPWSVALSEIKNQQKAVREEIKELRELANPKKTAEERAADTKIKRLQKAEAELRRRIKEKDFAPKPRGQGVDLSDNPAFLQAQARLEMTKIKYEDMKHDAWWSTLTVPQKRWENSKQIWNATRNILYSTDDSFLGRQGWFYLFTHPVKWAKAVPKSIKSFKKSNVLPFSEAYRTDELNDVFKDMGLDLTHIDKAGDVLNLDDQKRLDLTEKVPVVGTAVDASGRAFAVSSNEIRRGFAKLILEQTEMGREIIANPNKPRTEAQKKMLKNIGFGVNILTGRGHMGRASGLSGLFGAPRFVVGTFQGALHLPILVPLFNGDFQTAKIMTKEYLKVHATLALMATLWNLFHDDDDDIEIDPRSSDFLKTPLPFVDNYKLPLLGPYAPTVRFLAQSISGQKKLSDGRIKNLREKGLFFATEKELKQGVGYKEGHVAELGSFTRGKLHPALNGVIGLWTGKNFFGERQSLREAVARMFVPLSVAQSADAWEQAGLAAAAGTALTEFFGYSTMIDYQSFTYKSSKAKKSMEAFERVDADDRLLPEIRKDMFKDWDRAKTAYYNEERKGEVSEKEKKKFHELKTRMRYSIPLLNQIKDTEQAIVMFEDADKNSSDYINLRKKMYNSWKRTYKLYNRSKEANAELESKVKKKYGELKAKMTKIARKK